MSPWIEIYDSDHVQWLLRQQVAGLSAGIGVTVSVALFVGFLTGMEVVPCSEEFIALGVLSLGVAAALGLRLASLRQRVWCVKLSPHKIMGYNHSRRATTFAWSEVQHLVVCDEQVAIVTSGKEMIEIPTSFADFTHVAHRILDLAELHRKPVFLKGQSMAEVDLYRLMPELRDLLATPHVAF
jgi:hypothetical protein